MLKSQERSDVFHRKQAVDLVSGAAALGALMWLHAVSLGLPKRVHD